MHCIPTYDGTGLRSIHRPSGGPIHVSGKPRPRSPRPATLARALPPQPVRECTRSGDLIAAQPLRTSR